MQKTYEVKSSTIYPLGVCFVPEGLHISAVFETKTECGILLYDKHHKDGMKIPFPRGNRKGNIYSMLIKSYQDRNCSYLFYQGEEIFQDTYAKTLEKKYKYGEKKETPARCKVMDNSYNWEDDKSPIVPFEDSILYMLHVRGFTKHKSSGVHAKGTYQGIIEKIPYLKELGITGVILMPSYEFDEVLISEKRKVPVSMEEAVVSYKEPIVTTEETEKEQPVRINYWGYQEGLYFLPKYSYAYTKDAVMEYKDMVKALHQNGIEVMMQFYFPPTISHLRILDVLKYWVLEYHIDGFHLMGADIPLQMLCKEPLLAETKILGEQDIGDYKKEEDDSCYRNFGLMNESFLYDIRKLLKGDDNQINNLIYHNRNNGNDKGVVNYIAKQDGFRLCDLVSYDRKHNMANGESNQDGNSFNYSWNCGVEGKTRKKNILSLRMRQMKNAMTFVFLSQGTPLLYSGDEFANTQEGNNNPYCQDNPIGWIKWDLQNSNKELLEYTKALIAFRKARPVLHMAESLRGMDYLSSGYPDVSYHGEEAWRPDTGPESRSLGILYCGNYGYSAQEIKDNVADSLLYIGVNMHWEPRMLGMPKLPKGKEWTLLFSTQLSEQEGKILEKDEQEDYHSVKIASRTIMVYGTKDVPDRKETEKNSRRKKRTGKESSEIERKKS